MIITQCNILHESTQSSYITQPCPTSLSHTLEWIFVELPLLRLTAKLSSEDTKTRGEGGEGYEQKVKAISYIKFLIIYGRLTTEILAAQ